MNTTKVEGVAIRAIQSMIDRSSLLEEYLTTNDKTLSWDGEIYTHKPHDIKKTGFKGKIPVQIKGTTVNSFSKGDIKFDVQVADLNNYLIDGGAIFFIVEMLETCETKIFYKILLPLDIKGILERRKKQEQKDIRIELKHINSSNYEKLEKICQSFLNHRKLQFSGVNYNNNLNNSNIQKGYMFTNNLRNLFEEDSYIYGKLDKNSPPTPISIIDGGAISYISNDKVYIDDEVYFETTEKIISKDENFIKIGNSIIINEDTGHLNYDGMGTLAERLKNVRFLKSVLKYKQFNIGQHIINYSFIEKRDIERFEEIEKQLKEIETFTEYYNINTDLNLDTFTELDYTMLERLIEVSLHKKKVKVEGSIGLKSGSHGFAMYTIGNISLLVFFREKNKNVEIVNVFSKEFVEIIKETSNGVYGGYVYTELSHKDILNSDNIDLKIIETSIKSISPTEEYISSLIKFTLELIKAYDINSKRIDLLNLSLNLCNWIEDNWGFEIVNQINKYLIIEKTKGLSKSERFELMRMEKEINDNFSILIAINILLKNKTNVDYYFDKLTKEEQDFLMNSPIYKLVEIK